LPFGIGRILSTALCGKQDILMDCLTGTSSSFFKQPCLIANSFQSYSRASSRSGVLSVFSAGNIEVRLEKLLARKVRRR
jgi:hypothetical protein